MTIVTRSRGVSNLVIASVVVSGIGFAACNDGGRETLGPPTTFEPDAGELPDAQTCGLVRCSRDLKRVLRVCDGREEGVVEECAVGTGCGDGRCVDACASAELSKGSIGCSFWTVPPEEAYRGSGSCFAAMVTNTWDRPAALSAELGTEPLDISKSTYTAEKVGDQVVYTLLEGPLPPGGVALVFLSEGKPRGSADEDFVRCPATVTPAMKVDPLQHGTAIERAFHLKTDTPVSAYSAYPYGGAVSHLTAATLLFPTSAWGTNYVAVAASTVRMGGGPWPVEVNPAKTLQIIAEEDDTEVRIRPTEDIDEGVDVPGAAKGYPRAWTISRGQVLQFVQKADLSGSAIETSKRVAIFGGAECTYLPSTFPACDVLQQQMLSVSQWGNEYVLVPSRTRLPSYQGTELLEQVPWRLVGAVDGTTLTYDPARPPGAPETLAAGESVTFMTDVFLVVESQDTAHPFYAGVYMTSASFGGTVLGSNGGNTLGETTGDADFVNVVPSDQYLDRYVFFADYTYPETNLTIVRRRTDRGFRPVELECAGEISGFRPVGDKGEFEFAWVSVTRAGVEESFPKGRCGYGKHEARSDGPFSVTVWGTGSYVSYGFPGGAGSRPINPAKVSVPR